MIAEGEGPIRATVEHFTDPYSLAYMAPEERNAVLSARDLYRRQLDAQIYQTQLNKRAQVGHIICGALT